MFFLSDFVEFGRKVGDKDKQPRKKQILTIIGTGIVGTGVGGYIGGKDAKRNAALNNMIKRPKRYGTDASYLMSKKGKQNASNYVKNIENRVNNPIIQGEKGSALRKISEKSTRNYQRVNNKLNKIKNVKIIKGAAIGLAAGLGGAYIYKKLKDRKQK